MVSLIIGGDIVPSFNNIKAFNLGEDFDLVDDSCRKILFEADFRVFNLETPLVDTLSPIDKEGANFCASTKAVNGLKALNIDVLGLANNHCKDQGAEGLLSTINVLKKNNIKTIGYGTDFQNCESTAFLSKDGVTIAVIACAETEFTIWSNGELGAIPYHAYYTNDLIASAKKKADAVVVLYHGGKEYFPYAAPYQIDRCRLMVECGADFVLCQHSHCISCLEKYKGGTILYGQGNFIFHQKNNLPWTKEGLLAKISIDKKSKNIEFIPTRINENDCACMMEKSSEAMNDFRKRNFYFNDMNFIFDKYRELALQNISFYYERIQGSNSFLKFVRKFFKRIGIDIYNKRDKLALLNLLQNEAHRELFIQALKDDIENR